MEPALATEETVAPRVRRVAVSAQTSDGPMTIDTDSNRIGIHVVNLRAHNTGLDIGGNPAPGTQLILAIRQGVGGPWTWIPGANFRFAGGTPGPTATVQNHRDIYTLIYDGTEWNESARALDVA